MHLSSIKNLTHESGLLGSEFMSWRASPTTRAQISLLAFGTWRRVESRIRKMDSKDGRDGEGEGRGGGDGGDGEDGGRGGDGDEWMADEGTRQEERIDEED